MNPQVGSAGVVFLRLLIAGVLLCVMWRPRRAALGRMKAAWPAMPGAGTLLAGHHIAFFAAVEKNVPLGVVATIEFLGPFTIALAASRRLADLVPACMAAGGVALLSEGGAASRPRSGVVLAAPAACSRAAYILVSARMARLIDGGQGAGGRLHLGRFGERTVRPGRPGDSTFAGHSGSASQQSPHLRHGSTHEPPRSGPVSEPQAPQPPRRVLLAKRPKFLPSTADPRR
ncbi:hypothetical protein [Streptomyces sp. NPDC047453]|uniref:EamA family transporter n=1 Tax=Streptomyces sp. NPDC047453 TaxID=3154812 RepID=UPI0033FD7F31